MDNEAEREPVESEDNMSTHEEVPFSGTGDEEIKELYEELCESLKGVIPEELYPTITGIRPIEVAIEILLKYGGRIRMHNPEIDLTEYYDIPEGVEELNDTIGSFTFSIPPSPFIALAEAAKGVIDADEEIIQSCDRKDLLPLVIERDGEVKRICLVNTKEHMLEVTLELGLQLDISLAGSDSEREEATKKALEDLGSYLKKIKQEIERGPKLFDNPEDYSQVREACLLDRFRDSQQHRLRSCPQCWCKSRFT